MQRMSSWLTAGLRMCYKLFQFHDIHAGHTRHWAFNIWQSYTGICHVCECFLPAEQGHE